MKIRQFEAGPLDTNAYLLLPENGGAILVDAPEGVAEIVRDILSKNGRTLNALLLTHGHWDHSWDAAELAKDGAKIYAGKDGSPLIEEEGFQTNNLFSPSDMPVVKIDHSPQDGETIEIAGVKIKCFDAPGHCPGSVVYYIEDGEAKYLFAGDVIFQESVGRADLWGGDYSLLKNSIKNKVYTLPNDTLVFTGHGPATTIEHEKAHNPFVRG